MLPGLNILYPIVSKVVVCRMKINQNFFEQKSVKF